MNSKRLEDIVNAVLYEGYILYPYRASSTKNQRERFTFGRVYPQAYSIAQCGAEPFVMQTECLVGGATAEASLNVSVRFLHPVDRAIGRCPAPRSDWTAASELPYELVPELRLEGRIYQAWQEAVEREVALPPIPLKLGATSVPFRFDSSLKLEPILDSLGNAVGVIRRSQAELEGIALVSVRSPDRGLFKVTVRVQNHTSVAEQDLGDSREILMRTMASTHAILNVAGGEFISLMDPPAEYKLAAAGCRNTGTWPVLVGDEDKGERTTMLSSPIILYDYPEIAPESRGPLFDGTEIDEILTLRIRTMTDEEKSEMREVDAQARRLLERAEATAGAELLNLHGAWRKPAPRQDPDSTMPGAGGELAGAGGAGGGASWAAGSFSGTGSVLDSVEIGGASVGAGCRVRVWPKARADLIDTALEGRIAVVEAVERDAEGRVHVAVVFEGDPGMDLGLLRQPGHRFFYGIDEVEPVASQPSLEASATEPRIP